MGVLTPITNYVAGLVTVAGLNKLVTGITELQSAFTPGPWTPVTVAGGYTAVTSPGPVPAVRLEGNGATARAVGRITGTMTGTVTIANVPAGLRPGGVTALDYVAREIVCGTSRARCRIYVDGSIIIDQMTTTGTQIVDLSGLTWPVA